MSLWTARETMEVRIRQGWGIRADSIFIDKISQAVHLHQTVTSQNRDWTEEQQIEIAPLSKLLWVAVCLQAFTNVFSRGSHGRPLLHLAFPIAYIATQMQHLQSRNYEAIRVGVLRRLPGSARSRSGGEVLLFNFNNPTAEDNDFYDSVVKLALEADDAEPID